MMTEHENEKLEAKDDLKDPTSYLYKELTSMATKYYRLSEEYLQPKREQWKVRKSLYNNQMRGATDVGDPLLFSTIQTIIASLYNDKLNSRFKMGNDKGGQRADNLGYCSASDYGAMEKDVMDFFWLFDACFYGKGFITMYGWDSDALHPLPSLIDPMHSIIDPSSNSINGLGGKNASRFFGWEEKTTKREMKDHGYYFNLEKDGEEMKLPNGYENSLIQQDDLSRDAAANLASQTSLNRFCEIDEDEPIIALEMFMFHDGQLVRGSFANKGTVLIGYQVVDKKFKNKIPVVERSIYPTKDFFGSSVCDFVEDKQRARARLQNIALEGAEYNVYGMYLVNREDVDIDELATPYPNKIIGVDGDVNNKLSPIQRNIVNSDTQFILETLKYGAEQATGTPAIQQGMSPDTSRTATELATQRQTVDKRYSLSTKILGWSESKYWLYYYRCYSVYMTSSEIKHVVVQGATGDYDLELKKKDIIDVKEEKEPVVIVESQEISEAKRSYELQVHSNLMTQIVQYQYANLRYGYRKLVKLSGYTNEECSLLLPPTPDELQAKKENEELSNNKYVDVSMTDNHIEHLAEHENAEDNKYTQRHIQAHERAMILAKRKPEIMPAEASTASQPNQSEEAVAVGAGEQSPQMDYKQGFPNKI